MHRRVHRLCTSVIQQGSIASIDTGRNRQETRDVTVFAPRDAITEPDWQACITLIIRVERHVHTLSLKTGL